MAKPKIAERAQYNRKLRADVLRDQLKGLEYLRQVQIQYDKLMDLQSEMESGGNPNRELTSARQTRIKAIEVACNIQFKRLAKVLPDLRSVELVDEDGVNPFSGLADALKEAVVNLDDDSERQGTD